MKGHAQRLRAAVKSFGIRRFRVSPPADGDVTWTIHVRASEAKHVLGIGGTKLLFISRLSGLHVQLREEAEECGFQFQEGVPRA